MHQEYTDPVPVAEPYNISFAIIEARKDLRGNPKRLYALLVSLRRRKKPLSQVEMAKRLGASSRSVVRWCQELADVGLLQIHRLGQGRPNTYTLLGIDEANLNGRPAPPWIHAKRIRANRRARLVELYGEQCLNCGSVDELQMDHVVATARGGPDVFLNLQLVCRPCNLAKGTNTIDYRPDLGARLAGHQGSGVV